MSLLRQIKTAYLLTGIFLVYFLLRIPNLTLQPIFADEAIYIRWAQIAKAVPSLRFVSLQDGKTPLFMWAMAPFLIIFSDPLFAGRFLSVVSGFFTLLGVYFLGRRFFNQRVGLIGTFLVAITPFSIFFDRMALVDSMLAAFTIWSIYFGLKLVNKPNFIDAIVLGILLGGGWLTKTPGMVNIALLPLLLLDGEWKKPALKAKLFSFGPLAILSALIAGGIYLIQRVDPNFHQLSSRNADYVHPLSRVLQYPFDPLWVHFLDTINFSLPFLGPLLILIPLVLFYLWKSKNHVSLILLLWIILPATYELEFIKAFTSRYLLYCVPLLIILSAEVLDIFWQKKNQILVWIFLALEVFWSGYFSFNLLTNPAHTPLARNDHEGYFEGWTAGFGLKDIAEYLASQANQHFIVVGTEGSFGTLPEGVWIYLDKQPNIAFKPAKYFIPENLRDEAKRNPTFFIANRPLAESVATDAAVLKQYLKAPSPTLPMQAITLYQVYPQ